ncbi:MAG: uracil-DNA glycosylase [Gammaproteobacteria bacterium]|nr:uracil-DNA glycosylase [Gammaproteobacteria bacterium]
MAAQQEFDQHCRQCPRLSDFLDQVGLDYPEYHARPVAPFGAEQSRLLIVGLAPGLHGANATGRPFTGDHAGILLYETLFQFGFSNQPQSRHRDDGLQLIDCRITNAVKCLPPANKPVGSEVDQCNSFLKAELLSVPENGAILALGLIAHRAVIKALNLKQAEFPFKHHTVRRVTDRFLIDSYHCSRYNTQTKRLTVEMFQNVFETIKTCLGQ